MFSISSIPFILSSSSHHTKDFLHNPPPVSIPGSHFLFFCIYTSIHHPSPSKIISLTISTFASGSVILNLIKDTIFSKKMAKTQTIYAHFHDIPDPVLTKIFSLVTDTRTRNAMSLVCEKWKLMERSTRISLALRGNIRNLLFLPTCFTSVTNLDLSLLSPWGHPIFNSSPHPSLLALLFKRSFPSVVCLTVYATTPSTLSLLAPQWPELHQIKLVRWHHRHNSTPLGSDFVALFKHCSSLASLDLSHFSYWAEDLPPALQAYPAIAASLVHLNILAYASAEGFKSPDLLAISASCPNLRELLVTCGGFVGAETLLGLASNCPRLSLLHLVDTHALSKARGDPEDDGYSAEEAGINQIMLIGIFSKLPLLEELVLDVCHNVRDTWPALEMLNSMCPKLKSLRLGHLHGICRGIDARPGGIALCSRLESLSIKNCADLTDSCLISISFGCPGLIKFWVQGCKSITEIGITKLASILRKTLIDVKISCCKNLNTVCTLRALEPIQENIKRLHIDCVWENAHQEPRLETSSSMEKSNQKLKKRKSNGNGNGNRNYCIWPKLQSLSLWIAVGEKLTPLSSSGLQDCPLLEEIQIIVEGDCRKYPRPSSQGFGLSSMVSYPKLSRMKMDCELAIGYALTAPYGNVDLSLWERFYLTGIGTLNITELNYWPPQDPDVNQRGISLPAPGLLAECASLRKLFIHGTANEHLMMFLLKIPALRDVQLREDYYPASETNDAGTDSCSRFENALNRRRIPD